MSFLVSYIVTTKFCRLRINQSWSSFPHPSSLMESTNVLLYPESLFSESPARSSSWSSWPCGTDPKLRTLSRRPTGSLDTHRRSSKWLGTKCWSIFRDLTGSGWSVSRADPEGSGWCCFLCFAGPVGGCKRLWKIIQISYLHNNLK